MFSLFFCAQLRRLSVAEEEKKKSKEYLARNVQLSVKNNQLAETVKSMQAAGGGTPDVMDDQAHLQRSMTRPNSNVNQLGVPHSSKVVRFLLSLLLSLANLLRGSSL